MDAPAIDFTRLVDARYIGQSYELTIPWNGDFAEQRRAFDEAHAERYGFHDPDARLEIVVVRLVATVPQDDVAQRRWEVAGEATPKGERPVFIAGKWRDTPLYDRETLPAGTVIEGPAIIDQFDSTTYVRPDQDCRCDDYGFLHLSTRG